MDTAEKYRIERINNDIEYYKKKCIKYAPSELKENIQLLNIAIN